MQLQITRDVQAQQGLMGGDKGATFTLSAWLEVDEMEAALIDRFKRDGQAVTKRFVNGVEINGHTVGDLRTGLSDSFDSLDGLMEFEQILSSSFDQLSALMEYGSQFDSERTIGSGSVPMVSV